MKLLIIILALVLLNCAKEKEMVTETQKCDVVETEDTVVINCGDESTTIDVDDSGEDKETPDPTPTPTSTPSVTPSPSPSPVWYVCKKKHKKYICWRH